MATLQNEVLDRIDMYIMMLQESIESHVNNIEATDSDDTIENVAYEIKRVRTLKSLRNVLYSGKLPDCRSREFMEFYDIIGDMFLSE